MRDDKRVKERQEKDKRSFVEALTKAPIVTFACTTTSVSRATYYRWCKEDISFMKQSEEALNQGREFINDISEAQIIHLIEEKKLPAISLWLKNNSSRYGAKKNSSVKPFVLPSLTAADLKLFNKARSIYVKKSK